MRLLKENLTKTNVAVNNNTAWKDARVVFLTMFDKVVEAIDGNANVVSDLAATVEDYEEVIEQKDRKIANLMEKVRILEKKKDCQEVKDSQEDMTLEIKQAMTTLKVLDLDMDKETDDRKVIVEKQARH
jgi:uncharacterized protein YjcR